MRQDEKLRKKIQSKISLILDPAKKIPNKIAKKLKKIKKPLSGIFASQYGDEIGRKGWKKILVPNFVHTWPGEENSENDSKKIHKLKNLILALFLAKTRLDRLRKRKKKILVPNFAYTRPRKENSEKNSKKIQKPLSGIFVCQNGMIQAEKQRKKF